MAEIDRFMSAIMAQESGGREQVANKRTGAHGLFQIMPNNWRPWAKEAGLGANAKKTAENQRKVARYKMQQYYNDYGSWDLVAAAWFGGPGAASALKRGDKSVLTRSDGNMTIGQYIAKAKRGMGASDDPADDKLASQARLAPGTQAPPEEVDSAELWTTILGTLADQVAGGARQPLEDYEPEDELGEGLSVAPMGDATANPESDINDLVRRSGPEPIPDEDDPLLPQPGEGESEATLPAGPAPEGADGLDDAFSSSLSRLIAAAPGKVSITSGFRSVDRQQQLWNNALKKYGSPAAARKWVAPPGKSKHNSGHAADLKFENDKVRKWVHANASKYGLHFPLSNENWHIEPLGSRD